MYSKKELTDILKDNSINDELFKQADKVRKEHVGDEVHLRGLIEFSNICKCFCKYCGLRCENTNIDRYRLTQNEIVDFARKNDQNLTEKQFIINSLGAMDDKPWDESKHKRDKDGKFAKEGHSRVDSELYGFKKNGNDKYKNKADIGEKAAHGCFLRAEVDKNKHQRCKKEKYCYYCSTFSRNMQ